MQGHNVVLEDGYNSLSLLKPLMRMSKRGHVTTVSSKMQKYCRPNELAAHLSGKWFYLGEYKCIEVDVLDIAGYHALPVEVRLQDPPPR